MRTTLLRVPLGLVALAFGCLLTCGGLPLHYADLVTAVTTRCGLCSVLGLEQGERMFLFLLTAGPSTGIGRISWVTGGLITSG